MDIGLIITLLVLGVAVGFAAGLLGIGGGMLLVPFMTLILTAKDFPKEMIVHMAIATSLATPTMYRSSGASTRGTGTPGPSMPSSPSSPLRLPPQQ